MRRILIISFSNLNHDARVNRQIAFLKDRFQLTVACHDAPASSDYALIRLPRVKLTIAKKAVISTFLLLRLFDRAYRLLYPYQSGKIFRRDFDLILANDIEALPLAFWLKGNAKIIFDAHEYAPRHFEEKLWWRIFFQRFNNYLCTKYIPLVDDMMTVNEGLAREYEKEFNVKSKIVTNANYYTDLAPTPVLPDRIRLVHHGAANPSRRIELMIEMMNYLDERFTLDLILLTPPSANKNTRSYLDFLKSLIIDKPKVRILPPVASDKVIQSIHPYDIGVCFIPHVNFNYSHGLPNKLYDYVQARLGIAIGPTEEMTKLVTTNGNGIVSDNFDPKNLATYLNALTKEKVEHFKNQSNRSSRDLSAEKNKDRILDMVEKQLKKPSDEI